MFAAFEMFLRFEEFDDFQWFEVQSLRRSMLRLQGVSFLQGYSYSGSCLESFKGLKDLKCF